MFNRAAIRAADDCCGSSAECRYVVLSDTRPLTPPCGSPQADSWRSPGRQAGRPSPGAGGELAGRAGPAGGDGRAPADRAGAGAGVVGRGARPAGAGPGRGGGRPAAGAAAAGTAAAARVRRSMPNSMPNNVLPITEGIIPIK